MKLFREIRVSFHLCASAYCAWVRDSEGNFLIAMIFGGILAISFVMLMACNCSFSPYFGSDLLELLAYVTAAIAGLIGGYIAYHVQQYCEDPPEL